MSPHFALWFATQACNYRCPYCWQDDRPLQKTVGTADQWIRGWNRLRPNILDITGGEPLGVPWMVDVMSGLDPSINLALTTNLSNSLLDLIKRVPPTRLVSITASWHPTQRMSLEHFTAKCVLLSKRGYAVTVNYVTWPEQLWMTDHFRRWFQDAGLVFHVDPYAPHSEAKSLPLSDTERTYVGQFLTAQRSTHPTGYYATLAFGMRAFNLTASSTVV